MRYNIALVKAGFLAFIGYFILSCIVLPGNAGVQPTPFALLFQGVVYFGGANVCYFIGPLSERFVHPADPERYRQICYRLGYWFSVLLPFTILALLTLLALFHP